jgi:NADH-quinone oxidoreductase subunit E
MIEEIARLLSMPFIRVLEVATFYTMFNLEPVGTFQVQVCTTTPCWLRGSDAVVEACKEHIHPQPHTISDDGKFSWVEVECLGACVNAPVLQIGKDFYEDLDGPLTGKLLTDFRAGANVKPGPQNGRRTASEPEGGALSLQDSALYDGSVIGKYVPKAPPPPPPAEPKKPGAA